MGIPASLERDATELRDQIKQHKADGAAKRAAAEKLVEEVKGQGLNPLTGTSDADKDAFERIDAAYKEADALFESAAEGERKLHRLLDHAGGDVLDRTGGDPTHPLAIALGALRSGRTLGQVVAESESYKAFLASGQLKMDAGPVRFDPVEVANKEQARLFLGGRHGPIRNDAGDGSPMVPIDQQLVPPVSIPKRMPTVLDLITVSSTGREAVTWTKQTARTTATGTTVAFGTALPKSRYQYQRKTATVLRKGHHAVVDEGNIADQEEFQGIVNDELLSDLRLIVEADVLTAAGGSDWTGILNAAGIGDFDTADAANKADALHRAITVVRVALEREPTAYGLSPEDFEDFYLEKGEDGHYLHHRGPLEGGPQTVWGLPATVSTVFTKPIVGDWARGATLWVRDGISIAIDRIDDQFLEGLWTIRAQTRAAFAVKQPLAFCTVENFDDAS